MRVALLGDSIFDNAAYTAGEPDVATHLQSVLPRGSSAVLLAVDGATVSGIARQLEQVPPDATHIVMSVGGNDALRHIDLLSLRVSSSAEALHAFATPVAGFEESYRSALTQVTSLKLPTIVCTIYNGALSKDIAVIARLALALFNDAILRAAVDRNVDVLELRSICTDVTDYANPIEPSGRGGWKIATAIAGALRGNARSSRVFPG